MTTDNSTTFDRLAAMLAKDRTLALDHLTLDSPLEGLGIDSLGMVEMLWNVEDEFKIKLPSKIVELHTLGDVVRYVDALVALQGTRPTPAARPAPSAARPT